MDKPSRLGMAGGAYAACEGPHRESASARLSLEPRAISAFRSSSRVGQPIAAGSSRATAMGRPGMPDDNGEGKKGGKGGRQRDV
eukprot:scaffold215766_cov31-Tisochrysis_lutea.AAC.1